MRIHHLDHIALAVANVDRALEFYAGGLGLPAVRLAEYRSGSANFPSVRVNEATIIDLFAAPDGDTEGAKRRLNHLCLVAQDSVSEIRAHLESIGAPIDSGPSQVFGARGIGTAYYTRDPDENVIEVRTYNEEP
jgi:catechol 2,3-dioxygenase-like lactoylglutathione lyase family enzyme